MFHMMLEFSGRPIQRKMRVGSDGHWPARNDSRGERDQSRVLREPVARGKRELFLLVLPAVARSVVSLFN